MKLKWNFLLWAAVPALLLLATGCSGINTTQSVSPATFFMPGFMHYAPPPPNLDPAAPAAAPVVAAAEQVSLQTP